MLDNFSLINTPINDINFIENKDEILFSINSRMESSNISPLILAKYYNLDWSSSKTNLPSADSLVMKNFPGYYPFFCANRKKIIRNDQNEEFYIWDKPTWGNLELVSDNNE